MIPVVGPRLGCVSEFQVTFWRDLPSMVAARDGDETVKSELGPRFAEAIDEAAMRLGDTGADEYLAGWRRSDWQPSDESAGVVLDRLVGELQEAWPEDRVAAYLDALDARPEHGLGESLLDELEDPR